MQISAGERLAIVSTIDPVTVANSAATGDWVDMADYSNVVFIFATGDMASETIDAYIEEATTSGGAGAATLKSATQLAANASTNDGAQIVVSVSAAELTAGFRYVRPCLVTGGATGGPAACVGLAYTARYQAAADGDLASVKQILP
ncbi:MAG: hypothetical protein IT483_15705 [Gammaproteobacteria bacterium]|nr:hypothetical protein [Gammaproteobacteria bacterium]